VSETRKKAKNTNGFSGEARCISEKQGMVKDKENLLLPIKTENSKVWALQGACKYKKGLAPTRRQVKGIWGRKN